ncbi:hypothetical protein CHELA1G11_30053 [Hyphomicrobiales bacterium]|nr:hypothetical protein CHELA1G11_30053 [Hyphomicrobiales bacterium]CAH1696247.1 hypothetical protein CHELA1G2_30167 [Hyphomicrobiales bacterium]
MEQEANSFERQTLLEAEEVAELHARTERTHPRDILWN